MNTPTSAQVDPDRIAQQLAEDGVRDPDGDGERNFRIAMAPHPLSPEDVAFFAALGDHLLAFYRAIDGLYRRSVRGTQPAFVAAWLDQGKPTEVIRLARMGRYRRALPRVLRPDVFRTDAGYVVTELDSVPGGIGLTDALNHAYGSAGFDVCGGTDGMVSGMARALVETVQTIDRTDPHVAVVVSEESAAYRPEMAFLARRLRDRGRSVWMVRPEHLTFTESGLCFGDDGGTGNLPPDIPTGEPVDLVYRFFELFDLPNIPKAELVLYAARKGHVTLTPPPKAQLEEKLALALFHHPALAAYFHDALGVETMTFLRSVLPPTWVMDPAPVPAHGVIPGLTVRGMAGKGQPVQGWQAFQGLGQKDRQWVVKPSGFSERAWGSRGVVIGHDLPEAEWDIAVAEAVAAFPTSPHILQPFLKAQSANTAFSEDGATRHMRARTRLCPYYFVADDTARLGGMLATHCPADKKKIHGMRDAILAPCAPAE